jgi:V/A-type H+-transporting ATPase subunit I
MFKPLPMKHVELRLLREELPRASLLLAELGLFSPDERVIEDQDFPDAPGERFRELYHRNRSRLDKITDQLGVQLRAGPGKVREVGEADLEALDGWLGDLWAECAACEERTQAAEDELRMVEQLGQTLDNFAALNIDLGRLQAENLFLDTHIGLVPRANLDHLSDAIGLAGYLLFPFHLGEDAAHVVIMGPREAREGTLRSVLDTAGFRSVSVPPELRDEPEKIRQRLEQRGSQLQETLQKERAHTAGRAEETRDRLQDTLDTLTLAEPYVRIGAAARASGFLSLVRGWVPAREVGRLERGLRKRLAYPFQVSARDPERSERAIVPSAMATPRALRPFCLFVRQYGIPRYGEFEPSSVFAATFVLMFGMMFGDIGHGAVIAVAAVAVRRLVGTVWLCIFLAGLSSVAFGFLYGSIFGFEHLIHPVWMSPLSDPVLMLQIALVWGIVFLVVANLLNIHNRLIERQPGEAAFGDNGLMNLALYAGLLWGVFGWLSADAYGTVPAVLTLGSLGAMAAWRWVETEAPVGERVLMVVIETFETVMRNVSSTLSFLRVAAFGLNHVALAIAVFTLADMMDTTGQWITIVLGNLFILVLEGAIVTIQVLRLEYYEGFSRYFSGDGREFQPLRLEPGTAARPA